MFLKKIIIEYAYVQKTCAKHSNKYTIIKSLILYTLYRYCTKSLDTQSSKYKKPLCTKTWPHF